MRRQPIYGLDIVRFFAATAVLVYHLGFKVFALPGDGLNTRLGLGTEAPAWTAVSWWGWIGVQVFFVISGLVIAYSAEGATWKSFFRSRVARLIPAMLICATLIAVVVLTWSHTPPGKVAFLWAKSVTFFPLGPWLAGQFWTLPIEIFFYGLIWILVVGGAVNRLEILAWAIGLASAAYWIAITTTGLADPLGRVTALILLQHGCYFAIGMLLSIIDRKGLNASRVALGVLCLIPAWFQISAAGLAEGEGLVDARNFAIPFAVWLASTGLIAASLYWKGHVARWVGPHGNKVRIVGLITYPLYLIHMHSGGPVLIETIRLGAPPWAGVIAAFAVSVGAALVIAVYLEPPLHRVVNSGLKRLLGER